jgi:hypothetical protein
MLGRRPRFRDKLGIVLRAVPLIFAAGILGTGIVSPAAASASTATREFPMTLNLEGQDVQCVLVQSIDHAPFGDSRIRYVESVVRLDEDPLCSFLSTVCVTASWIDPYGNPETSATDCAQAYENQYYAPVGEHQALTVVTSVHVTNCNSNCDATVTFIEPSTK